MATQLTVGGQAVRPFNKREALGQGATSTVWLGESEGLPCVLKLGRSPAEAPRFADEAERLLFAASPEFPQLLAVGLASALLCAELGAKGEAGTPYLLLSSAPGSSLDRILASAHEPNFPREALAHTVARDIGAALSALHTSGAAHGDVKPSNIVVGEGRARLVDFGLSGAASAPLSGGTRRYLAQKRLRIAQGMRAHVTCGRSARRCWRSCHRKLPRPRERSRTANFVPRVRYFRWFGRSWREHQARVLPRVGSSAAHKRARRQIRIQRRPSGGAPACAAPTFPPARERSSMPLGTRG